MRHWVGRVVDASGRRPFAVLAAALVALAVVWSFALRVLTRPHTDLRELLPTGSPGLLAFEWQLARAGGGATLIVVAESPSRDHNERFIDALAARLERARTAGGAGALIDYVESDAKEARAFFEHNRWLYADVDDLRRAADEVDRLIAVGTGAVEDLDDDASGRAPRGLDSAVAPTPALSRGTREGEADALGAGAPRLGALAAAEREFPSDHFETRDGSMVGLRIVTQTTGMGDSGGDALLALAKEAVAEVAPRSFDASMRVGFAGDVANAVAEKQSVVGEAAWASAAAAVVIASGVVWFFGSAWSLAIIALPALLGVGAAYAFAYFCFGYVNTTGMFLGAIILGNGINYPIVLLARYREFRALGREPARARREAVQSALRAELVGACVGAIAYGSLTSTRFRGFNQFGWIGFVGMLLVWGSMIPCVPALLAVVERVHPRSADWLRSTGRGRRGPIAPRTWASVARWADHRALAVVVAAGAVTLGAASRVPGWLHDPWEYDFDRLGSRGSKHGGAGEWSNKADAIFGGRSKVGGARMVADTPDQIPLVKQAILRNDEADPAGRVVAAVVTVADVLPGTPLEQRAKLAVLQGIRERLTPAVLAALEPAARARAAAWLPPGDLKVLGPADLPALLRRRFEDRAGVVGTVFYVRYRDRLSLSDGHHLLRISATTDDVAVPGGAHVATASRATVFAEMIRSMRRDGPRATAASLVAVAIVVIAATRSVRGALAVLGSLAAGVLWLVGGAAWMGERLNYVNFVVLPITFGIGCEYPFNVYDRSRLLGGDVTGAVERVGGAVALCSFTTVVGYASLLFADFQALQSFGRLAVTGEIACVTCALFVMPAVLRSIDRRFAGARSAAHRRFASPATAIDRGAPPRGR